MSERLWCPNCNTDQYYFGHGETTCSDCETDLTDPPGRVQAIWKVKEVAAVSVGLSIFILPIAWVILNIGEEPLYATKTVTITQTQPYGILPAMAPVVFIWILIGIIILFSAYLPRL